MRMLAGIVASLFISAYAAAAILVLQPSGAYTTKQTLSAAATSADTANRTVIITSALSAVQSNISSATVHQWPADRMLKIVQGGSIANTTIFRVTGPSEIVPGSSPFVGTGRVVFTTSTDVGTIFHVASATCPSGSLENDGAAVSRTTYATLFGVIGTTFGAGNGTTTFNLPDLRGRFVRSWDHGKGIDTARAVFSRQSSAVQTHTHTYSAANNLNRETSNTGGYGFTASDTTGGSTAPNTAPAPDETRPTNIAFPSCIKF